MITKLESNSPITGRQLAANAAWSTISHILARGSLVAASMILARSLDTKSFATYSFFQLTISMLAAYSAMGMGITASKFFSQLDAKGEVEKEPPPLATLWITSITMGSACALSLFLIPAAFLQSSAINIDKFLLALGVFIVSLNIVPNGAMIGLEKYRASVWISALAAFFLLTGACIAAGQQSINIAVWSFIAANLIQSFCQALICIKYVGWTRFTSSLKWHRQAFKQVLSIAGPMFVVGILAASGQWLVGRILISNPNGAYDFALYSVGIQWYALALFLPGIISRVLLPVMIKFSGAANDTQALVCQGVRMSMIAAASIVIVGALASPWLLPLYGDNYASHSFLLIAFLLAAIPSAPANAFSNAMVAANKTHHWMLLMMLWLFTLMVTAILTRHWGYWSGAISLFTASLALSSAAAYTIRRHHQASHLHSNEH